MYIIYSASYLKESAAANRVTPFIHTPIVHSTVIQSGNKWFLIQFFTEIRNVGDQLPFSLRHEVTCHVFLCTCHSIDGSMKRSNVENLMERPHLSTECTFATFRYELSTPPAFQRDPLKTNEKRHVQGLQLLDLRETAQVTSRRDALTLRSVWRPCNDSIPLESRHICWGKTTEFKRNELITSDVQV